MKRSTLEISHQMKMQTIKIFATTMLATIMCAAIAQKNPILNSFKQGSVKGGGNCASVAIIKAAIHHYGVGNVFKFDRLKLKDRFYVGLKSGENLSITAKELEQTVSANGFRRYDIDPVSIEIKNYADTCFAVMCKSLQNEKNEERMKDKAKRDSLKREEKTLNKKGSRELNRLNELKLDTEISLSVAIDDLNDGFNTRGVASVLGLEVEKIKATRRSIQKHDGAIMNNVYHAVYTTERVYDESGDVDGFAGISALRLKHMGRKCGFLFCGPSGAYIVK